MFKLGKVTGPARGPGLIFIAPFAQRIHRVSLRIVTLPIQSQGIITKNTVTIDVSAVAYYRVEDPVRSVIAIENVEAAISHERERAPMTARCFPERARSARPCPLTASSVPLPEPSPRFSGVSLLPKVSLPLAQHAGPP